VRKTIHQSWILGEDVLDNEEIAWPMIGFEALEHRLRRYHWLESPVSRHDLRLLAVEEQPGTRNNTSWQF
jgi:hypothetical protein